MRVAGPALGLYVGNLQVLSGLMVVAGLMRVAGPPLGLYVGNLQAYRSYAGCYGPPLGLYVGNLQVLCGLLDRLWGCMLATYRSYAGRWTAFGAVCWQPTGLMRVAGPPLGLYVGNLKVLSVS